MKKTILFLLVVFSLTAFHSSAENVIVITNPKSGESDVFKKGSFIVFALKADGSTHEGLIRAINDSSIEFDEAQVSFSQMHILAGTTKSKIVAGHVANAVGTALIIAGTSTFNCGLNFFSYGDYYYWPLGGTVWLAGACVAGLGYMLDWATPLDHHVRVRNYRGWDAHITNDERIPAQEKQISQPADSSKTVLPYHPDKPKKDKKKRKSLGDDDVYGK
jgi:hypothetical protein